LNKNFITLLKLGATPAESPYSHKQIAEWCESFWNKYSEIDVSPEFENIVPILADVETQWDLYLVNSYSLEELRTIDLDSVCLPPKWFVNRAAEVLD